MADITRPELYGRRREEKPSSPANLYRRMTKETIREFDPPSKSDPGGAYGTEYGSIRQRAEKRLEMLDDPGFKPYRSFTAPHEPPPSPPEDRHDAARRDGHVLADRADQKKKLREY